MSPYEYYLEWRHESNPWKEAYRAEAAAAAAGGGGSSGGGDSGTFQRTFLIFLLLFAALNLMGQCFGKVYSGSPLSTRPTVLAGTFHALATAVLSTYLLLIAPPSAEEGEGLHYDWSLWQTVAIPLSLSYFAVDAIWYCLPRSDGLIFFHHVIMCFCHYPVINDAGATLAGAGDATFAVWLSIVGYTSEMSTCLMNYRWYLIQTLEKDWIGFAIVNVLVTLSWAYRIILFAYLLAWEIIPRTALYVEKKQLLTYVIMFTGHAVIGLLSLYWLRIMCRGGLKSLLTFKKKKRVDEGSPAGFSFGDDIGREADTTCSRNKKSACAALPAHGSGRIIQEGIEEARGWVDGTLFQAKDKSA